MCSAATSSNTLNMAVAKLQLSMDRLGAPTIARRFRILSNRSKKVSLSHSLLTKGIGLAGQFCYRLN